MRLVLAVMAMLFLFSVTAFANEGPDSIYTGEGNSYVSRVEYAAPAHTHRVGRAARKIVKKTIGAVGRIAGQSYGLVAKARSYIGKTARELGLPRSLWCSDFMNMITHGGTGSRAASSWASAGSPDRYGCVGCVAVMGRNGGGHVGIVSGYDSRGNPILISGNFGGRVAEAPVPRGRVYAYRSI